MGLSPFVNKFTGKIISNKYINQTISLYSDEKFSKIRFWDAPFMEVEKLVARQGVITELGCGEGIFTNYLAVTSPERQILGIEIDPDRFQKAEAAGKNLPNISFKRGDATTVEIPKSDNIVLFHLLHHLGSYANQEKVIKNCLKSLKDNGKLIIVEVDIKPSFKYLTSWFVDCFLVPWLFEKRIFTKVYYRNKKRWMSLLTDLGASYKITSVEKGKPFTHIVFECEKK